MRTPLLVATASLFFSTSALAGGLGPMLTGGTHTATAYFYDADGEQGTDVQSRPNAGVGAEFVLGNDDDKIHGVTRFYVQLDAPLADPDTGDVPKDEATFPAASEQGWSKVGVMAVGVQWSLLGDPKGKELALMTLVGSGFATINSLEYLQVDVGPTYNMMLGDRLQLSTSLAATGRYRKGLSMGGNLYAGVRYIFD